MSDEKNIVDLLAEMLAPYNMMPRSHGNPNFARIPAVWRDSTDYNISVSLSTGRFTDFASGNGGSFEELVELLGGDPSAARPVKKSNAYAQMEASVAQRIRQAKNIWTRSTDLSSTRSEAALARKYIEDRGIPLDAVSQVMKIIRATRSGKDEAILLFPINSPEVRPQMIGVQRIYIDKDGKKRARTSIDNLGNEVKEPSKAMIGTHFQGAYSGGFLIQGDRRRFQRSVIAICEGPETGLAIHASTGMPVYIAYDANGMERVNIEFLSMLGVTEVIIAGDNDFEDRRGIRRGAQAARKLAERILDEAPDAPVRIAIPAEEGDDWLDVWKKNPAGMADILLNAPEYIGSEAHGTPTVIPQLQRVFARRKLC